jgi:anti-sigma regulatory factor (Ser/Thr protein kinase)
MAVQVLELALRAHARSVGEGRRAIACALKDRGFSAELVDSVRLAVSEALSNAVRHAYAERRGPIELGALLEEERGVVIVVRDHGSGFAHTSPDPGTGLGLTLMESVSDTLEIAPVADGGTEVRMTFSEPSPEESSTSS